MELHKRIIEIIDAHLIYCLIPIILTLIFAELLFKNRFETKKALHLIRWTIIIYTVITILAYLIGMTLYPDKYAFIDRATGPYAWAYWIMFISALILPFTLLINKLASRFGYVLLIAFAMKIGMYFEYLVIMVTSFHKDYLPKNSEKRFQEVTSLLSSGMGIMFLKGIMLAILILGIFEIIKRKNGIKHK